MKEIEAHRLIEALALLPMLHVPQGNKKIKVGVVGSHAELMAAEIRRWPDVNEIIITKQPGQLKDKRIRVVDAIPDKTVDLMLLSPNQDPDPWFNKVITGGVIQATTYEGNAFTPLSTAMRKAVGNGVPWREYLPRPLYGVIGHLGVGSVKRRRNPPKAAKRLTTNFLPCLFTFGKDEIPLAFKQPGGII